MSLTHQMFLQSLRELSGFDAERFDAHRMPLIAWLVDHAWGSVPAYRERLDAQVVGGSLNLERWCELPLLRPADIAALGDALVARALPPEAREIEETSDLPNWPSRLRSRLTTIAEQCEREWFFEQNGLDLAAPLAILDPNRREPRQGQGWSVTFAQSQWTAGDADADATDQLAWLGQSGARLLRTNAANAERLAEVWGASGGSLKLEAMIVADASLAPARRAAIEAAIGLPLVHVIEHSGFGVIAASDRSGGYLVPAATCVMEVVDMDGRPVPAGATGELVVTPLYEYVVPHLRFATGIRASPDFRPATLIGVRRLAAASGVSA